MPKSTVDIVLKTKADLRGLRKYRQEAAKVKDTIGQGFVQRIGQRTFDGTFARLPRLMSDAVRAGIKFNANIETLQLSFQTLLGSASKAQDRIEELTRFSASTPFQITEIADASRLLQALSGDALASGEGLRIVGDAAAASGRGFGDAAMWIGRLYAGLKSGTPVGEATMRLLEMGLVTGDAKRELEGLAGTARSEEATFAIIQKTFAGTAGAMQLQAESFSGLVSTLKDNLNILAGELTRGPFEQLKAGLETILILMGKMDTAMDKQLRERLGEIQRLRMEVAGATTETAAGIADRLDKRIATKSISLQAVMKDLHRLEQLERMPRAELLKGMDMFGGGAPLMEELTRLRGLEPGQEVTQIKSEIALLKIQRDKLESMTQEQKVTNEIKQEREETLSATRSYVAELNIGAEASEKELAKLREARQTDKDRLDILKARRAELFGAPISLSLGGGSEAEVDALARKTQAEIELLNAQIEGLEQKREKSRINNATAITRELIQQARIEREMATKSGDEAKVQQLVEREKELIGQLIVQYRELAELVRATDPAKAAALDTRIAGLGQQQAAVGGSDTSTPNSLSAGYGEFLNQLTDSQGVATQTFNLLSTGFSGVSSGIADVITGAQSFGEMFQNIGNQIVSKLIEMTIQAAAFAALYSIFGAGTGGLATGPLAFLGLADGGLAGRDGRKMSLPGFASGGYTGAGGRLEPAGIVHRGEYVISSPRVKQLGVETLDGIQGGKSPGVASDSSKSPQFVFVDNRSDARRLQDDPEFETQVIDIMRRNGGGR